MKSYILYQHAGSQNHGCEALVRTISAVIKKEDPNCSIGLASFETEEDEKYGLLDSVDKLYNHSANVKRFRPNWWKMQWAKILHSMIMKESILTHLEWLDSKTVCDCYIAIGGDNYCYNGGKTFYPYDRKITKLKRKRILLGCSIEPNELTDDLISILKEFELITARESLTFNALSNISGLKSVKLIPDSAFTLPTVRKKLPAGFIEGKTIGINASPLIMNYEAFDNAAYKNYCALIQYIIKHTEYQIALIPHVVWKSSDDRVILKKFYDLFSNTGRVILIDDCNCMELKGYISRCEMFIGARTHATIAAYSSYVPTLVVGYSVKAKGIAKDLFGDYQHYVLPIQTIKNENQLIKAFKWLNSNQKIIKEQLIKVIPEYIKRVDCLGEAVKKTLAD